VLKECFVGNEKFRVLAPLIRLAFSMPASSAEAERAFSSSGRICAPLRSRLSPRTVESSTMVQHYVRNSSTASKFSAEFLEYLTNGSTIFTEYWRRASRHPGTASSIHVRVYTFDSAKGTGAPSSRYHHCKEILLVAQEIFFHFCSRIQGLNRQVIDDCGGRRFRLPNVDFVCDSTLGRVRI